MTDTLYTGFGYLKEIPDFVNILNSEPPEEWIRTIEGMEDSFRYLPIDKVEFLLERFFGEYKIEILRAVELKKSALLTVRVHYLTRGTGKTLRGGQFAFHDGIGCCLITQKITEIGAFPLAKSLAIKDACDHIGVIFGRNLNRKDPQVYTTQEAKNEIIKAQEAEMGKWIGIVNKAKTYDELIAIYEEEKHNIPANCLSLFTKRKIELNGK